MNATLVATFRATGGIASAQSVNQGYDMLVTELRSDLKRVGLPAEDLDGLTLSQLAELVVVMDAGASDTQKKDRVETIIRDN